MRSRFFHTRLMVFGTALVLSVGSSLAACVSGDVLTSAGAGFAADINSANKTFTDRYNTAPIEGQQAVAEPWKDVAAQYTDDATFAGTLQPFWLEGKDEIEDLWKRFFTAWPTRNIEFRHRRVCSYDGAAVETGFIEMYMGGPDKGTVITYIRYSRTWVRSEKGDWQIANMNVSRLPGN